MLRVRVLDEEVTLGPGRYFVGRGPECHVRIDHPRVSRRHALITVGDQKSFLQDLDSANGVFVRGRRVDREPVELESGLRILIAEVELLVSFEPSSMVPPPRSPRLRTPAFAETSGEPSVPGSTHTTDFFELMSKIVERMLSEGRVEQATSILQARLEIVLEEVRHGRIASVEQVRSALSHALLLAERTREHRWITYVLEILARFSEVPAAEEASRLEMAIRRAPGLPTRWLDAYAESLKRIEDPLRRMQGIQYARAFQRAALAAAR